MSLMVIIPIVCTAVVVVGEKVEETSAAVVEVEAVAGDVAKSPSHVDWIRVGYDN